MAYRHQPQGIPRAADPSDDIKRIRKKARARVVELQKEIGLPAADIARRLGFKNRQDYYRYRNNKPERMLVMAMEHLKVKIAVARREAELARREAEDAKREAAREVRRQIARLAAGDGGVES